MEVNNMDGIDVSTHQGKINWSGIDKSKLGFVILRCGYRGYGTGKLQTDDMWTSNLSELERLGINRGAYFFSQATNALEGKQEADFVIGLLKGHSFQMPIYIDSEMGHYNQSTKIYDGRADHITNQNRTNAIVAFCNEINAAGYIAGFYCSRCWLEDHLIVASLKDYEFWIAAYTQSNDAGKSILPYGMWQYTSSGSISGITSRLDTNHCYKDYPSIIRVKANSQPVITDTNNTKEKGSIEVMSKYPILFNPLNVLRVTCPEGYNVGGVPKNTSRSGHLDRAAIDEGGSNTGCDYLNMTGNGPDLKVIKIWTSQNVVFYQTVQQCIMADGRIGNAVFECIHCNNDRFNQLGIRLNKVFPAGSNFYSEGTKAASGNHLHLQVGGTPALTKNAYGAYKFINEYHPYRVLWAQSTSNSIKSSYNYPFKIYPANSPIGELVINATYKRRTGPGANYAQCQDGSGNNLLAVAGKYAVWKVNGDSYCVSPACQLAYGGTSQEEWIVCGSNGTYVPWGNANSGAQNSQPAQSQPAQPVHQKAIEIKAGKWNVRKGPGTNYAKVGLITGGNSIGYDGIVDGWYKTIYGYIGPAAVKRAYVM
jgi:GH25 family lysozyme M1 (1,4-beta-N-acetylmuramidase)